ncbi:hypothetical protein BOTBODRAFT_229249 [Botryobasidium botryosum FD-172 SS1]|uniref:Uncharacterized protein n=1 Tax=Botryobasidium botryosum (strain FD-172 SS1) TaxID=930990 RepID=A0A067M541_BOTB1|nr:hypothetical protein BOTBODRAFT_229249 [Botryobasidium botryosum FD-172 SS1]
MSGASIWLLVAWTGTRSYLPEYWLSSSQIAACFTLWPLLVIYAIVWNLSLIGLLLFTIHYRSSKNYERWKEGKTLADPEASWKKTAHSSIWKHSVCNIPLWSSALQSRCPPWISADEESHEPPPLQTGAEGSSAKGGVETKEGEHFESMKLGKLGFLPQRKKNYGGCRTASYYHWLCSNHWS